MPSSFQLKSQNDMKDWYILHKLPTGASEFLIQVSDPEGFSQYCRISISIVSKFGLWPASVETDENSSFSSLRKRERRERKE